MYQQEFVFQKCNLVIYSPISLQTIYNKIKQLKKENRGKWRLGFFVLLEGPCIDLGGYCQMTRE